jgi:hypothetical protein
VEGQVRVQFNLKVEHSPNIHSVATFPNIVFPVVWLQEVILNKMQAIAVQNVSTVSQSATLCHSKQKLCEMCFCKVPFKTM